MPENRLQHRNIGLFTPDYGNFWNGQGFYQKACVDSGKTEEQ